MTDNIASRGQPAEEPYNYIHNDTGHRLPGDGVSHMDHHAVDANPDSPDDPLGSAVLHRIQDSPAPTDGRLRKADNRPPRVTPRLIRTVIRIVAPLLAVGLVAIAVLSDPSPRSALEQSDASAADQQQERRLERRQDQGGDRSEGGRAHDRTPADGAADTNGDVHRLDQPVPVPSHNWVGWARYPADRCAWISAALREWLHLVDQPVADDTACTFATRSGDQVRVKWGDPVTSLVWDPTGRRQFTQVAGLNSRITSLPLFVKALPGACMITVNTRSVTSLTVLVWNDAAPTPRCASAKETTAQIARSVIPAAGGTPWADTPQHPLPDVVDRSACDLLESMLSGFDDVADGPARTHSDDLGDTCTFASGDTSVSLLLSTGPHHGLATVTPLRPNTTARQLATLPAREERLGDNGCALVVEITPDQVLRTIYRSTTRPENPCGAADLITARTVEALLDRTDR